MRRHVSFGGSVSFRAQCARWGWRGRAGGAPVGAGRASWVPGPGPAQRARRRKGRIAAAAAALAAALAATSATGVPAASASPMDTVIVTATGLLSPVTAVLEVGGTVLTQFHLINGVEALVPAALEPVLKALPGITVTPDLAVSVQSVPESTGPHTPSDVFLQETGATGLAAQGDTGQGVTVAVLDTGIDNLPDFSGRLIGEVNLTSHKLTRSRTATGTGPSWPG